MFIFEYQYQFSDFVGNVGVALLLTLYFLNTKGTVDSKGLIYNIGNLLVALLIGYSLYYNPNINSIVIEMFWGVISLYGIYNYYRSKTD